MTRKEMVSFLHAKLSRHAPLGVTIAVDRQWRDMRQRLLAIAATPGSFSKSFRDWFAELEAALFEPPFAELLPDVEWTDGAARTIEPDDFPTLEELVELLDLVLNKLVIAQPQAPESAMESRPSGNEQERQ